MGQITDGQPVGKKGKGPVVSPFEDYQACLIGFRDVQGNVVIEPRFDRANPLFVTGLNGPENRRWIVTKDGLKGIVDYRGEVVLPLAYATIELEETQPPHYQMGQVVRLTQPGSDKFGLFDLGTCTQTPLEYEGLEQRKTLFQRVKKDVRVRGEFFHSYPRLFVQKEGKWLALDTWLNVQATSPHPFVLPLHDKFYLMAESVEGTLRTAISDKNGQLITPFSENRIAIATRDSVEYFFWWIKDWHQLYAIFNDKGDTIWHGYRDLPKRTPALSRSGDRALRNMIVGDYNFCRDTNGVWGAIGRGGELALPFEYEELIDWTYFEERGKKEFQWRFEARKNGRLGVIDRENRVCIPFQWNTLQRKYWYNGKKAGQLYYAKDDSGWAAMTLKGEKLISGADSLFNQDRYLPVQGAMKEVYRGAGKNQYAIIHDTLFALSKSGFVPFDSAHFHFGRPQNLFSRFLVGGSGKILVKGQFYIHAIDSLFLWHNSRAFGVIDPHGKELNRMTRLGKVQKYDDHRILVATRNGNAGIWDVRANTWLIDTNYTNILGAFNQGFWLKTTDSSPYDLCTPGAWKLTDRHGDLIPDLEMDYPLRVHAGFCAPFQSNGKLGVLRSMPFAVLLEPEYDEIVQGVNELRYRSASGWGIINTAGLRIPPVWDGVSEVTNGHFMVFKGTGEFTRAAVYNWNMEEVIPLQAVDSLIRFWNLIDLFKMDWAYNNQFDMGSTQIVSEEIQHRYQQNYPALRPLINRLLVRYLHVQATTYLPTQMPVEPAYGMFRPGKDGHEYECDSVYNFSSYRITPYFAFDNLISLRESFHDGSTRNRSRDPYNVQVYRTMERNTYQTYRLLTPFTMDTIQVEEIFNPGTDWLPFIRQRFFEEFETKQTFGNNCVDLESHIDQMLHDFSINRQGITFHLDRPHQFLSNYHEFKVTFAWSEVERFMNRDGLMSALLPPRQPN